MTKHLLKILTVADVPPDPNSGAAGTVYHTNVALRALGHQVSEIWSADMPRRIHHGNLHALLEQPRSYRPAIRERLVHHSYDVVQISQPQAYLAARELERSGFPGVIINRSHGLELRVNAEVPVWCHRQGIQRPSVFKLPATLAMTRLLERHWKVVARHSDGIVLTSEMDRDYLLNHLRVDPTRVRVIHHGVPTDYSSLSPLPLTEKRLRKLLYVGQFAFVKGPHLLADIINDVLRRCNAATFTWVTAKNAHGEVRKLLSPAVRDRVILCEWCNQHQLQDIYDAHGIFVFPSLFEGAGKAAVEAMARGLCVVTSRTGGMQDLIKHGQNGFTCTVGDVSAFKKQVLSLLGSLDEALHIADAAAESARQYTWDACARRLTDFYRDLAKHRSHMNNGPAAVRR